MSAPSPPKGLYTTPAGGGLDGVPDIQYAQLAAPSRVAGNQYNGRVDYTHDKDALALSMYFTRLDSVASDTPGGNRPVGDLPFSPLNTAVTLTYTRVITPTLVNEARANLTRFASNQLQAARNSNFRFPGLRFRIMPSPTVFVSARHKVNRPPLCSPRILTKCVTTSTGYAVTTP